MRITLFTGTRADYGIMRPLALAIARQPAMQLSILASGSHLSPEFGKTVQEIERDGLIVEEKIEILQSADGKAAMATATGLGLMQYPAALKRLAPDVVIGLGDRFELFAFATSAAIIGIPLVHLHGGEITLGAVDEFFRHAITKMATIHFTATEEYRKRVIQLGEHPDRVVHTGSLAVQSIVQQQHWDKARLFADLNIAHALLDRPLFAITFHPATTDPQEPEAQVRNMMQALDRFPEAVKIITMPNADPGSRAVRQAIVEHVEGKELWFAFDSLGQFRYFSLLSNADICIGNSSSGIIEAPSFRIPTIDIGSRQKGRTRGASIIECIAEQEEIFHAVSHGLSPNFRQICRESENPYAREDTLEIMMNHLKNFKPLAKPKEFYDV